MPVIPEQELKDMGVTALTVDKATGLMAEPETVNAFYHFWEHLSTGQCPLNERGHLVDDDAEHVDTPPKGRSKLVGFQTYIQTFGYA